MLWAMLKKKIASDTHFFCLLVFVLGLLAIGCGPDVPKPTLVETRFGVPEVTQSTNIAKHTLPCPDCDEEEPDSPVYCSLSGGSIDIAYADGFAGKVTDLAVTVDAEGATCQADIGKNQHNGMSTLSFLAPLPCSGTPLIAATVEFLLDGQARLQHCLRL